MRKAIIICIAIIAILLLIGSLKHKITSEMLILKMDTVDCEHIKPGDIITTISSPSNILTAIELSISGNFDTPYDHALLALGDGKFMSSERKPTRTVSGLHASGIDVRYFTDYIQQYPNSKYVLWRAKKQLSNQQIQQIISLFRGKEFADGYIRAAKSWIGAATHIVDDRKLCTQFVTEAVNFPSNKSSANTTLTELINGMPDYAILPPLLINFNKS